MTTTPTLVTVQVAPSSIPQVFTLRERGQKGERGEPGAAGGGATVYPFLKTTLGANAPAIQTAWNDDLINVGDVIQTASYHEGSDLGGCTYRVVASATGTEDGGRFITFTGFQLQAVFGDVIDVRQFGAVGDGVANDRAAIQAAIDAAATPQRAVLFPDGIYQIETAPLVPRHQMVLLGSNHRGVVAGVANNPATLRSATVTMFKAQSSCRAVRISGLNFRMSGAAAHVFDADGYTISMMTWEQSDVTMLDDDSSVFKTHGAGGTGEVIETRFADMYVINTTTANVPSFDMQSSVHAINLVTWDSIRFENAGNYCIWIEDTDPASGGWCQDNTIRNVNFQQCLDGAVWLGSCRNILIENCSAYDAPTPYTTTRLRMGAGTVNTLPTAEIMIVNWSRRGGSLASGVFDASATSAGVRAITAVAPNGAWSWGGAHHVLINPSGLSPAYAPTGDTGGVSLGRGVVRTAQNATANRPTSVGQGSCFYDTTLEKPIWWNGSVWKDAGGSTV